MIAEKQRRALVGAAVFGSAAWAFAGFALTSCRGSVEAIAAIDSGMLVDAATTEGSAESASSASCGTTNDLDGGVEGASVSFTLESAVPGAWWVQLGDEACGYEKTWLRIREPDSGTEFPLVHPQVADCSTCALASVPVDCQFVPLADAGTTLAWDGTYFAPCMCGEGLATACVESEQAPPGMYEAVMCGCGDPQSSGECTPQTCVDVPFQFPSAAPVIGVLPAMPADGG